MKEAYNNLKHKHKYLLFTLALAISFMFILQTPLQVHAVDIPKPEKSAGAIVHGMSNDVKSGAQDGYTYGCSNSRLGYVCYVVDPKGKVIGAPKAFKATSGTAWLDGTSPIITTLKGNSVTGTPSAIAPWNKVPYYIAGGSEMPAIKSWLQSPQSCYAGNIGGYGFIAQYWSKDLVEKYKNKEAYIVVESLINFIWCDYYGSTKPEKGMSYIDAIDYMNALSDAAIIDLYKTHDPSIVTYYNNLIEDSEADMQKFYDTGDTSYRDTADEMKQSAMNHAASARACLISALKDAFKDPDFVFLPGSMTQADGKKWVGSPILGTPRDMENYREKYLGISNTSFASITCNVAPNSEFTENQPEDLGAGFGYYNPNKQPVDVSTLQRTDIGLCTFIVLNEKGGTHTWDSKTYPNDEGPAPREPEGEKDKTKWTIIKSYRVKFKDGTLKDTIPGSLKRTQTLDSIIIEDEPLGKAYNDGTNVGYLNYKVIGWKTSGTEKDIADSTVWESSVPGPIGKSGTSSGSTTLDKDHHVLYVLLEATVQPKQDEYETNYLLREASITRRIYSSAPDRKKDAKGNEVKDLTTVTFQWVRPAHKLECGGHTYSSHNETCSGHDHEPSCPVDCTDDHKCKGCECDGDHDCGGFDTMSDTTVVFKLQNSKKDNYPEVLATKSGWQKIVSEAGGRTEWIQECNDVTEQNTVARREYKGLDFLAVIHRGKDPVTLVQWRNAEVFGGNPNSDLAGLATVSGKSRYTVANKATEAPATSSYDTKFTATIADNSQDLDTKMQVTKGNEYGDTCSEQSRKFALDKGKNTNITASVKVQVYNKDLKNWFGSEIKNETTDDTKSMSSLSPISSLASGTNRSSGVRVAGGSISFMPYVEMIYDTPNDDENHHAYVFSTNLTRTISFNSYAEINWTERTFENITLDSLQWSTHAQAAKHSAFGTVLPGGATLSLRIKDADRQKVTLISYQPLLNGAGKTQVDNTGTSSLDDASKVKSNHESFVSSVISDLEKLLVKQWWVGDDYSIDPNTGNQAWNGGQLVDPDVSLIHDPSRPGAAKTSSGAETKYYLGIDAGEGTGEGDLDVNQGSTSVKYYTFFTDTAGNIRMVEGDTIASGTANRGQGTVVCAAGGSPTGIAADFEKRTRVISKLQYGLGYRGGNDQRSEVDWASDGKWYNEAFDGITYAVYTTDITVGFAKPGDREVVLDPKLCPANNGTSDMFSSYFTAQFKTGDTVPGKSQKYIVGTFNGKDVPMTGMDMLFWSRKFYIPNVTTQDLH